MSIQRDRPSFGVLRSRVLALAALAAALAAPLSGARAQRVSAEPPVTVTQQDVAASNTKVRMAYDELSRMWSEDFSRLGARFETPSLVRYRGGVRTACGVMGSDNAAYCPGDNAIYFDELFVAAQARRAGRKLGTDGDMAAVGVIAHEMGHAVAMQLGHASRYTYRNESTADCLAGAFAQRADAEGQLEKGDVDEAFYAMFTAGDPSPRPTGDPRVDRMIAVRASLMGHGTWEQRTNNFRAGLEGGAKACLAEFQHVA